MNFLSLPQLKIENQLLKTEGLNSAIDSYGDTRRSIENRDYQRAQQEEQKKLAAENQSYQRGREARSDSRASVDRLGKMALAGDSIQDPGQRAAFLQRVLREHPDAENLGPEYRDPAKAFKLIAAEAGQVAAKPDKPEYRSVGDSLVEIGPNGARPIYTEPKTPDPIKDMLMRRLQANQPQAAPQVPAATMQPQSLNDPPRNALLQNVTDSAPAVPSPQPQQPPQADLGVEGIDTPYGKMSRQEAQEMGGAMLLDPRYQAAGKAILDSLQTGKGELSKPAATQLEEKTISAALTLGRLQEIKRQFKPEFQQIPSRLKLMGASWGASFGGTLSPQLQKNLQDFAAYKAVGYDNFNQLLKELSGSAVSTQELQRQKIVQPNPGEGLFDGDDPVTFVGKLNQGERIARAAIARMNFMKSRGVAFNKETAEQFLSLEDVPAAVDRRGNEIEAELKRANPNADPMTLEREAEKRVRMEFGI